MSTPEFLSFDDIEDLHRTSIAKFGGTAGIRDRAGLESAIFHPQNVFFYAGGDLFDVAAAYAFHIAQAQAYLDGNKRTAIAAALTFLESNDVETFEHSSLYDLMIAIAERRAVKEDIANKLRELFSK